MSLHSSGVNAYTTTMPAECDGWVDEDNDVPCLWAGVADLYVDPGAHICAWTCPACNTTHDVEPDDCD